MRVFLPRNSIEIDFHTHKHVWVVLRFFFSVQVLLFSQSALLESRNGQCALVHTQRRRNNYLCNVWKTYDRNIYKRPRPSFGHILIIICNTEKKQSGSQSLECNIHTHLINTLWMNFFLATVVEQTITTMIIKHIANVSYINDIQSAATQHNYDVCEILTI